MYVIMYNVYNCFVGSEEPGEVSYTSSPFSSTLDHCLCLASSSEFIHHSCTMRQRGKQWQPNSKLHSQQNRNGCQGNRARESLHPAITVWSEFQMRRWLKGQGAPSGKGWPNKRTHELPFRVMSFFFSSIKRGACKSHERQAGWQNKMRFHRGLGN